MTGWGRHGTTNGGDRSGYRPPSPDAAAHVRWPDGFGTRFAIFVDTEEAFDWNAPFRRDGWTTAPIAALPAAHRRFADRGVAVTYLIDYPVATDPRAIDALQTILSDGRSAIGAQLHPWVNPPFDEPLGAANSFAGNLPPALEAAKLDLLTDAIAGVFGQPLAYRAGRYGIGPATARLIAERGYRLDSSMRSGYDYAAEGGPDFAEIANHPFRFGPAQRLIELPLTTVYTGLMRRGGVRLHRMLARVPHGVGIAARSRLLNRVALSPEAMPIEEACEAVRVAIGEGVQVLNFSYHSPSVVPGHTPYVRNAAELARFWHWWEAMLDLLNKLAVRPVSLEELLTAAG